MSNFCNTIIRKDFLYANFILMYNVITINFQKLIKSQLCASLIMEEYCYSIDLNTPDLK